MAEAEPGPSRAERWQRLLELPWEKLLIWGAALVVLVLLRHFLLVAFLTFMLCYLMRGAIVRIMRLVSPHQERLWLERALGVGCFALLLMFMLLAVHLVGPLVLGQGQALVGQLTGLDPERELHRLLDRTVGAYQFDRQFGDPKSAHYQEAFTEFERQGLQHLSAYREFPTLQAAVEGAVSLKLEEAERARITRDLAAHPAPDPLFDVWLRDRKLSPAEVTKDPVQLAKLQAEWRSLVIEARLAEAKKSPRYLDQVRSYYEERRQQNPKGFPYDFATYLRLREAYPKGERAFADVLGPAPDEGTRTEEQRRQDFRQQKQHELAAEWWTTSATAVYVRQHAETGMRDVASEINTQAIDFLRYLLTLPSQIITAFLLSLFIVVDFTNLAKGVHRLEQSKLGFLYHELVPGLTRLGHLIGRAFYAQGIVSFINSVLTFIALWLLGVENPVLLSGIVFVCSLVPVIGVIISSVPIALMAFLQPGGSVGLAIMAIIAIVIIHFIESTVLSPRIVGSMLHLHPVIGIAALAIGEYFFGVWGLLFAYPLTVYLITQVIHEEDAKGEHGATPV